VVEADWRVWEAWMRAMKAPMLDLKFTGDFLIELCKKKQFVTKQKTDKIK